MIWTLEGARALLRERGIVPMREIVVAILGRKPIGSWWGHPRGKLAYRILTALEDEPGVLVCKLMDGLVTFVDPGFTDVLTSVVTDRRWRAARTEGLSAGARRLLARVASAREVPVRAGQKKAAEELVSRWLVCSSSRHTPSGRHATYLSRWKRPRRRIPFAKAAKALEARGVSPLHLTRDLVES